MCRAGGRRCPHQSSPEYKKRAAERRRKNRQAKKNLVQYFQNKGMNDTAKQLVGIRPSQINGFLKEVGLDEKILGTDIPGSNAGLKDTKVEASKFVEVALKEMEKISTEESNDIAQQQLSEEEIESYKNELINDMAEKIYNIYQDNQIASFSKTILVYDYMDKLVENVDKFGIGDDYWKSIEDSVNESIIEKEHGKEYLEAVDTYMSNIKDRIYNRDYPKLIDNLDSFPDASHIDEKTIKACQEYREKDQYAFYYDRFGYALSNSENCEILSHKDLGNGVYFVKIKGVVSPYDDSTGPHSMFYKIDEKTKQLGNKFETIPIHEHDLGRIPASLGFDGIDEEKQKEISKKYEFAYYASDLIGRTRRDSMTKGFLTKTKSLTVGYKHIRKLAIAKNIESGQTFLQKNFSNIPIKHWGETVAQRSSYFQAGFSIVNENNLEASKRISKKSTIKTNIKKLLGEHDTNNIPTTSSIKAEKTEAAKIINSLDSDEQKRIVEYTDIEYSNYSSRAYGMYRKASHINDEEVEVLNNIIKKVSQDSVKRERFLYRSLKCPSGLSAKEYADSLQIGDVTVTNKLTSTSIKHSITDNFGNSGVNNSETVQFVYHTKKGAFVNSISMHDNEEEVIIPIGEKMVVIDKIKAKNGLETIIFGDAD